MSFDIVERCKFVFFFFHNIIICNNKIQIPRFDHRQRCNQIRPTGALRIETPKECIRIRRKNPKTKTKKKKHSFRATGQHDLSLPLTGTSRNSESPMPAGQPLQARPNDDSRVLDGIHCTVIRPRRASGHYSPRKIRR